jgi:hypothetical protein
MPPMDTGMAATLKDINICPMAMTIIGTHESRVPSSNVVEDVFRFAITLDSLVCGNH